MIVMMMKVKMMMTVMMIIVMMMLNSHRSDSDYWEICMYMYILFVLP